MFTINSLLCFYTRFGMSMRENSLIRGRTAFASALDLIVRTTCERDAMRPRVSSHIVETYQTTLLLVLRYN